MNSLLYALIFALLFSAGLFYFHTADKFDIIDKPSERSPHASIVLRGGDVIFLLGLWTWTFFLGFSAPWLPMAVTLIGGVSFIDDVYSLSDSVRLVTQFIAVVMTLYWLDILRLDMWWVLLLALIICVGASNVINFMDGTNDTTAGYSLSVPLPLMLVNEKSGFVDPSLICVPALSVLVFYLFSFRSRGKAKCFTGDADSISMAYTLLLMVGSLTIETTGVIYLVSLLVYSMDGCLIIIHRILLCESLDQAHRKYAYQLMANELEIGRVKVSLIYMRLQLAVSLAFIYVISDAVTAHWLYLLAVVVVVVLLYVVFMKKYYCLREEYLASIIKEDQVMVFMWILLAYMSDIPLILIR